MNIELPNFLIIGSAKCGTTALASILDNHPDCCMSRPKEVSFFQDTIDFQPNPNYGKGLDWYRTAFSHYNGEGLVGEATPSYSDRSRSPLTAKRIFDFNPQMKLIYMVRDPLQRQVSAWKMQWVFGMGGPSHRREANWALEGFDHWLERQRESRQWDVSRYAYQLAAYQELFPASQIHVMVLEDWKTRQNDEILSAMEFLGLDKDAISLAGTEHANRSADRYIQRPFIKKIRSIALVRAMINRIPKSVRKIAHEKISISNKQPPRVDEDTAIVREFIDYVSEDGRNFLQGIGRSSDIWPSLRMRVKTTSGQ
jgi:hypothetical protein